MNNKKSYASGVNIGSSSILVTFVLICLVTFAALSFVSANADNKLAKQTAERTTGYYTTNNTAEIYLDNANSLLSKHYEQSKDKDSYYGGVKELFSDNTSITVTENSKDDILLSYSVPASENQMLNVTLKVIYPDSKDTDMFEIKQWETITQFTEEKIPGSESSGFLF